MDKIKAYIIAPKYWDRESQKNTAILFDKGEVPKHKEQFDKVYNIEITIGSEVKEEKRVFTLDDFENILHSRGLPRIGLSRTFKEHGEKYE